MESIGSPVLKCGWAHSGQHTEPSSAPHAVLPFPGLHSVLTATRPALWVSVVTTPYRGAFSDSLCRLSTVHPLYWLKSTTHRKLRTYHLACLVVILFICLSICLWSHPDIRASLIAQLEKNLPAMLETLVWFVGQEDPLEKGEATHFSLLRLPWWLSW